MTRHARTSTHSRDSTQAADAGTSKVNARLVAERNQIALSLVRETIQAREVALVMLPDSFLSFVRGTSAQRQRQDTRTSELRPDTPASARRRPSLALRIWHRTIGIASPRIETSWFLWHVSYKIGKGQVVDAAALRLRVEGRLAPVDEGANRSALERLE